MAFKIRLEKDYPLKPGQTLVNAAKPSQIQPNPTKPHQIQLNSAKPNHA